MGNIDWTMVAAIGQVLAAAATIIGLLFVARQIGEAGEAASAQQRTGRSELESARRGPPSVIRKLGTQDSHAVDQQRQSFESRGETHLRYARSFG